MDAYPARIAEAFQFALTRRVLLLRAASGVGLDIALGALPFEEEAITRASEHSLPGGLKVRTCSAEDLIVMKAFAARAKDWIDVEGIFVRQAGNLDWEYILHQLRPLVRAKGAPEILDELARRRSEFQN